MPTDLADLVRDDAVHRELFVSPAIFEAELTRIFETTWVYVAHTSELAQPGDFRTTRIGRQPVIVCRGEDGRIRVLINRCTHRASIVCRLPRGNTSHFRCPYHGWTFRNTGELSGVSYPGGYGPDFDRRSLDLAEAPRVDSYRGFVFASLAPEGPSLADHLGPAREYIDRFVAASPLGEIEVASGSHRYAYRGNWKLQVENSLDGYHPNFVHRSYYLITERRSGTRMQAFGDDSPSVTKDFGNGHACLDQSAGFGDQLFERIKMAPGGAALVESLERERGPEAARRILNTAGGVAFNLAIYPNLVLIASQIRVITPIAVDHTEVSLTPTKLKGVPDGINEMRLRNHEAFYGPAGFGAPDDLEIFRRVQAGFQARGVEWLILGRGFQREHLVDGVRVAGITDETPQRAQYREWRRLMAGTRIDGLDVREPLPALSYR